MNYHLHNHLDLFLEPRVNLFTDGINGLESQKRYDIGAQAMAGLTYRFTGLNKTSGPSANSGALDNLSTKFMRVFREIILPEYERHR